MPGMTPNPPVPDISIVFTNWNTRDYMRDCIYSVREKTRGVTYNIVVVDDGSTDGSVEMLRTEFPDVKVIVNERNLGVAKAYNRGVAKATGRYIQMLNTDMILVGNPIKTLYDFLESHPEAAACGAWLRNRDMTSQTSFGNFPSMKMALADAFFLNELFPRAGFPKRSAIPVESINAPFETDYVTGASMLFRKSIVDKMGFLDDHFTSYYEETDFCYRVKRNGFGKVFFVPDAQIIHFGGVSFGKVRKYQTQLQWSGYNKFQTKHHGKAYSFIARLFYGWHYSVKLVFRFLLYLIADAGQKEEKKNYCLNAWYAFRFSLVPDETFTGK